jgi:hypothetical protein
MAWDDWPRGFSLGSLGSLGGRIELHHSEIV